MKYVILRCEDGARNRQTAALLEGAKTAHLQQLAQGGAAGVLRHAAEYDHGDPALLHRGLLGLDPQDVDVAAARCYTASANIAMEPGETAWCCDLVTQHEGVLIDPEAGRITTKESDLLVKALDEHLGAEGRRWATGSGPHHVLITRDPALAAERGHAVRSPHRLVGQEWARHFPKGELGDALRMLVEQSSQILESHSINRVRLDLGENPANLIWLWGPTSGGAGSSFKERTGLSAAVVSNSFWLQGLAKAMNLGWSEGPPSFEEPAVHRWVKAIVPLVRAHDLVYIHLRVNTDDPVERLCAMERIDQLLLKPLTDQLPALGAWRLMSVIDDRRSRVVPFVAIGSGLPQQPVSQLTPEAFAASPLRQEDGLRLFSWFTTPSASP